MERAELINVCDVMIEQMDRLGLAGDLAVEECGVRMNLKTYFHRCDVSKALWNKMVKEGRVWEELSDGIEPEFTVGFSSPTLMFAGPESVAEWADGIREKLRKMAAPAGFKNSVRKMLTGIRHALAA